tara:strand:+ start:195 stop:1256 length:1062 start_codon:yes stop_codon:yes gene_type:complete
MYDIETLEIQSYRRKYKVMFQQLSEELVDNIKEKSFLVIDSNVDKHFPLFRSKFDERNIFVIEAKEQNKNLDTCTALVNKLVSIGFKRNHRLVAVGGGIVQDITAFTASVLYRGVEWRFFPTTLLAQADSCIGSKTSINLGETKNLLGTFYPPAEIYCCPEFLKTLQEDDIKSGIGEMFHYYLTDNSALSEDLAESYELVVKDPATQCERFIRESLSIKKRMIEKDEFDEGERKIFNYGHTFGHAIEAVSRYKVSHGNAVTLGMDIANYISFQKGYIDRETYELLFQLISKNIPEYCLEEDKLEEYFGFLSKDKKNIDNSLVCILPYGIGNMKTTVVDDVDSVKNIIREYFKK